MTQQRGNVEDGFRNSEHVFEDRYTTTFVHNAQMEPRSAVAAVGRRQADRLHPHRRHRQLPHRYGARSRDPARKRARHLPVHGRQLRQQEPESGCRPDRGHAGEASRRARETRSFRAKKISSACTAAGRPPSITRWASTTTAHLQALQLRGYSGMGPYRKNSGAIGGHRDLSGPAPRLHRLSGLHEQDHCPAISAAPNFRRAISAFSR